MLNLMKMTKKMKKMNGKIDDIFNQQLSFQQKITNEVNLPNDLPNWYSYHMLAMMEELGEILKADKRWKTHRNNVYAKDEKIDEIVDVFITLLNICIFSDVDADTLVKATENKIKENTKRFENRG